MTTKLATHASARVIDGALLDRLDGLQAHLEANIIGQPEVIPEVVKTIKNAELGFTEAGEPRSAFLFLGPTGVGKTEVTLQFTEYVCGPGKLIRLDMSEFMNLDAVGLLIGTPSDNPEVRRGLLGQYYDRTGGTGTLLFDEIEKAYRQVQDLFLQILDASRITLGNGETLDLSRMFLVATSNIGSQMLMHSRTRNRETIVRRVQTEAKGQMRPEIYARFNPVVVFNRLDFDAQRNIARVHLDKVLRHMDRSRATGSMWTTRSSVPSSTGAIRRNSVRAPCATRLAPPSGRRCVRRCSPGTPGTAPSAMTGPANASFWTTRPRPWLSPSARQHGSALPTFNP